ncbi:MAG: glutathione S-transferase family protein [Lysobacterales bacterium]
MKFFDCTPAPSPRRARMLIAEKGLDIETVEVDLGKGGQFDPAFSTINPSLTVPVLLLDDGTALTENTAIAVYLEDIQPQPAMLGNSAKEKALVANWNDRCVLEGFSAIAESYRNFSKFFAGRSVTGPQKFPQVPELVERGRARAQRFFSELDERLEQSPYLAGEQFTMADISGLCVVDFAQRIKLGIGADQTHLQRWHDKVSARPSAKL